MEDDISEKLLNTPNFQVLFVGFCKYTKIWTAVEVCKKIVTEKKYYNWKQKFSVIESCNDFSIMFGPILYYHV